MSAKDIRGKAIQALKLGSLIIFVFLAFRASARWALSDFLLLNKPGFSHAVYDQRNRLLDLSLSSDDKYRLHTSLREIPETVVQATLLQEDQYHYWHPGVNPWSIVKGAFSTLVTSTPIGGSTISMQLARLRFGLRTRSITGKCKQILMSLLLEALYTKDELLEAYLNSAPYGGNVEGIGAASLLYYQKPVTELNLGEAITLSVIPQQPNARIPYRSSDSLRAARARLLNRAKERGWASADSLQEATLFPAFKPWEIQNVAPHFVRRVINENPHTHRLHTSLNVDLQRQIERSVRQFVDKNNRVGIRNAAVLLVENRSGKVRSYLGSADFWDSTILGQNDGIVARRSPGSALKPFVYALAMDDGKIHPGSLLKDTEFVRASYNPENYERDFVGPITATDALIRSRNVPAVMVLNNLGFDRFYDFLALLGIKKMRSKEFYGLSIILGGVEVRMDELASAYAMLATGGKKPTLQLLESASPVYSPALLSPEAASLTLDMLRENPRPLSGVDSLHSNHRMAIPWKTGTSFGFRDAWAAGIVGPYTLVVWLGNFDNAANPAFIGREAAGPLFFTIADAIASGKRLVEDALYPPPQVKKVKVCAVSGELPGPSCSQLRASWFIPGKSPIHTCSIHREIEVHFNSGLRLCKASNDKGIKRVAEFWSSDLMELFQKAGVARSTPPGFAPECLDEEAGTGQIPFIQSPQENIEYKLQPHARQIPFNASTDGDSPKTYWFVDDAFIGTSSRGETLMWDARDGNYIVRAVDSRGRSNQVKIAVVE